VLGGLILPCGFVSGQARGKLLGGLFLSERGHVDRDSRWSLFGWFLLFVGLIQCLSVRLLGGLLLSVGLITFKSVYLFGGLILPGGFIGEQTRRELFGGLLLYVGLLHCHAIFLFGWVLLSGRFIVAHAGHVYSWLILPTRHSVCLGMLDRWVLPDDSAFDAR
jgi:hypothetical protein